MATKELKSIKFPGLEDTYVIPGNNIELDATLQVEGMAADAKAVGDALAEAGNIDIDLTGATEGEAAPIDADTLGGIRAEEYIKKSDAMVITRNYCVVGGMDIPEHPTENMIWVQAEEIGEVHIGSVRPRIYNDKDIWIYNGTASIVSFDAIKVGNDTMNTIFPVYVKQFINNEWIDVKAKTWQGDTWVSWTEWVLKNGEFLKGSWGSFKDSGKVVEFVNGEIHLEVDGNGSATFYTTEKFDISGRQELVFEVSKITQTATSQKGLLHFGISDTRESHTYVAENSIETTATNEPQEIVVQIPASCYGEYYIKASITRSTSYKDGMYISSIRLQ